MLRRRGPLRVSVVATVVLALLLVTCPKTPAGAAHPAHEVCAAARVDEGGPSKITTVSLWAVPVAAAVLPLGPALSGRASVERTRAPLSVDPSSDLTCRAPPIPL